MPSLEDILRDMRTRIRRLEARPVIAGAASTLFVQTDDQVVQNTLVETSMFGTGEGSLTIPVGSLMPGKAFHITMRGQINDTGTPTLDIQLKLGSTVIASIGATALSTVANVEWVLDLLMTCRSSGVSGVVVGGGLFDYDDGTELSLSSGSNVAVDTTVEHTLSVTATWGAADPSNILTVREATVESLYPH